MPKNVPSPEECEEPEILYQRYLKNVVKPEAREVLLEVIEVSDYPTGTRLCAHPCIYT